uniref:Nucleophosmin/nucleoplasmin 3 n=1 Tax=Amazona collaria TaxID=241587 RepID=A0A8B9EUP8_9PSIT
MPGGAACQSLRFGHPRAGAGPGRAMPGRGGKRYDGSARHGPARPAPLPSLRCRLMEPHVPGSVLFGCELTASTKSYTFQVDEGDDSEHILALSVVCLTDGAKDECNVVEVVGRNRENQEIAVPVANLKLSCQPLCTGKMLPLRRMMSYLTVRRSFLLSSQPRSRGGSCNLRQGTHWDFSPWMTFTSDTSHQDLNVGCFGFILIFFCCNFLGSRDCSQCWGVSFPTVPGG